MKKISQIFDGLKVYFCNQELRPTAIKRLFNDKREKIYLLFIHD